MDRIEDKEKWQQKDGVEAILPVMFETIKSPGFKIVVDHEAYCVVTINDKQIYPNVINALHTEVNKLIAEAKPGIRKSRPKLKKIQPFLRNYRKRTKLRESYIPAKIVLHNSEGKKVEFEDQSELIKQEIAGLYMCMFNLVEMVLTNIQIYFKWSIKARIKSKFKLGKYRRDIIAYCSGLFYSGSLVLKYEKGEKEEEETNATTFTNELIAQLGLNPMKNISDIHLQIRERTITQWALLYGEFYVLFQRLFPKGTHFDKTRQQKSAEKAEKELLPITLFVYDVITDYVRIVNTYSGVYPETIFPWKGKGRKHLFDQFMKKSSSSPIINRVMRDKSIKNVYKSSILCSSSDKSQGAVNQTKQKRC